MNFQTRYRIPEHFHSNLGSPVKQLYQAEYDKDGTLNLVESGRENLYDYIQSHKDSVDIHILLQRYKNGDVSALSRAQGTFGDFTEMPKSYAELLNNLIKGESYFNELPVEVRSKFDHSFQKWLVSAGSDQWMEAMGMPKPEPNPASKSELVPVDPVSASSATE
uniref:Internal scaffolding protein n=1 Tax=Dulem virus 140 TaxID=3145617 RepID=A0AAU8AV18_9VIRU